MALTEAQARDVAKQLLDVRRQECVRLDLIRSYMRGTVCRIFVPQRRGQEYQQLVKMSLTNVMPLVTSTFAQNLFMDGYRAKRASSNAKAWDLWQANRMDARQSGLFRSAVEFGLAYSTVLPATMDDEASADFGLYSPRMLTAVYDDPIGDEWPVYALAVRSGYDKELRKAVRRLVLLDDEYVIRMTAALDSDDLVIDEDGVAEHGLGVTPVVRWLAAGGDLDDQPRGEVEPLMAPQDSLNNTTFGLKSTERAMGFRQRWATGLEDETDANGSPIEPFQGGQDRVWTSTSPDTHFGSFEVSPPDGYLASRQSTLRIITAMAQMAPHALLVSDGVANLSAEALAALESAQQRKIGEYKTSLGESAEQMLRLASLAAGDEAGWKERSAQVVWRDTESRSLAQVADALGKMAQMLGIPPKAMWEMAIDLLHLTQTDLERWEKYADEADGLRDKAMEAVTPPPPAAEDLIQQGGAGVVAPGPARTARTPVPAGA